MEIENLDRILTELEGVPPQEAVPLLHKHFNGDIKKISTVQALLKANEKLTVDITDSLGFYANKVSSSFEPSKFIGQYFGHWQAIEIIHASDKSIILRGEQQRESYTQVVAIKISTPSYDLFAGAKGASRQAQYMAKLKDNNVVIFHTAGVTDDGISYLVMEDLPNGDVVAFSEKEQLTLTQRLYLFRQVLLGVKKMHLKGVNHKDLKPSNIIMSVDNIPKIIDFDHSLATTDDFHDEHEYLHIPGLTKDYASPEQLEGDTNIDSLSDIFSLGRILFEIIFGFKHVEACHANFSDVLLKKYPRTTRVVELKAIIDKATHTSKDDGMRYQSADAFIADIELYLSGERIVEAYAKRASPLYKAGHYLRKYWVALLTLTLIAFVITVSIYNAFEERNEKIQTQKMFLSSSDPRSLESQMQFKIAAERAFNKSSSNDEEYFQELIGFGDAYYGQGLGGEALKFFEKAYRLFPKKLSKNRIIATTKLALAYYSLANTVKAVEIIGPYVEYIFKANLENPYLIELLLAAVEIEMRSVDKVFDKYQIDSYMVQEVLSNISLANFTDEKIKNIIRVNVYLYKVTLAYSAIDGDLSTKRAFISDEQFDSNVKPVLFKIRSDIEAALTLIQEGGLITHLKPLLYLWRGYIESELTYYDSADTYMDIGIKGTIEIFGEDHPRTVLAYIKQYGMYRYRDPVKALEAANKAYQSAIGPKNKQYGWSYYGWNILFDARLNVGDVKGVLAIYNDAINEIIPDIATVPNTKIDTSTRFAFDVSYFYSIFLKHDLQKYYEAGLLLEKEYAQRDPDPEDGPDIAFARINAAIYVKPPEDTIDDILTYIDVYDKDLYLLDNEKVTLGIQVAEYCMTNTLCSPRPIIEKAISLVSWSSWDGRVSIEKLQHYYRIANILIHLGDYERAKEFLIEVKPILERLPVRDNSHIAFYYYVSGKAQFMSGQYLSAQSSIEVALTSAKSIFGNDSVFTQDVLQLQKDINIKLTKDGA